MSDWLPRTTVERFLFVLILFFAAFFRFHGLGDESFWVDEVYSARSVERPWSEVIDSIPKDKPVLDYYVQKLFSPLGEPEFSHRFHSALFGTLAVVGIYWLGAMMLNRRIGFIAMALAAVNPFLLYYSQEARPYMLFFTLFVFQTGFFLLWYRKVRLSPRIDSGWQLPLASYILSVLMVYTLYLAFLTLGIQLLFLLGMAIYSSVKGKKVATHWRAVAVQTLLLVGVFVAALPMKSRASIHVAKDYFYRFEGLSLELSLLPLHGFWMNTMGDTVVITLAVSSSVLLLLVGFLVLRRYRCWLGILLLVGSIIAFYSLLPLYVYIDRSFQIRYGLFAALGMILLWAVGVDAFARWWNRMAKFSTSAPLAVFLVCVYTWICMSQSVLRDEPYRADYRGGVQEISKVIRDGDVVAVDSHHHRITVDYYFDRFRENDTLVCLVQDQCFVPAGYDLYYLQVVGRDHEESEFYRINIDVQTTALPEMELKEALDIVGSPAVLTMGDSAEPFLTPGFGGVEHWGEEVAVRWVMRDEVTIFVPHIGGQKGRLTVRLFPYSEQEGLSQEVAVSVNGAKGTPQELPLGNFHEPSWILDDPSILPGYLTVKLRFPSLYQPSAHKKNYGDFRTLAAAVQWIRWEPIP